MPLQHTHPAQIIAQSIAHASFDINTLPWELHAPYTTQILLDIQCTPFKPETDEHTWILTMTATVQANSQDQNVFTAQVRTHQIIRAPIAIPDDTQHQKLRPLLVNTFAPHALASIRQSIQHNLQLAGFPNVLLPPIQSSTLVEVLHSTDKKQT